MTIYLRDSRENYRIREQDGAITRAACNWKYSGRWLLQGFDRHNNYGSLVEHVRFQDAAKNNFEQLKPFTFKNGKPRWRVRDLDYGTTRVWGSGMYAVWRSND